MSGQSRETPICIRLLTRAESIEAMSRATPATDLFSLLHSLRQTPPRLIQSPPTQPRRASVALILRMKPAEGLVFEGHEPEGWTGRVIKREDWGLGLALEDFFQLGAYLR